MRKIDKNKGVNFNISKSLKNETANHFDSTSSRLLFTDIDLAFREYLIHAVIILHALWILLKPLNSFLTGILRQKAIQRLITQQNRRSVKTLPSLSSETCAWYLVVMHYKKEIYIKFLTEIILWLIWSIFFIKVVIIKRTIMSISWSPSHFSTLTLHLRFIKSQWHCTCDLLDDNRNTQREGASLGNLPRASGFGGGRG